MKHRITTTMTLLALTAAVITGCSSNNDNDSTPQQPPATTTQTLDLFDTSDDRQRDAVTRIIDIGHDRGEQDDAILAALTASRAEARWWIALDGTSYDLFGWNQRFGNKPRHSPETVIAIIHRFYQLGRDSGIDPTKDGPVEYAVSIQTTDRRIVDNSGEESDYYQDRTSKEFQRDRSSRLGTEDEVRNEYAEALPYARAAFDQFS
ncbi:hypothetical protein P3H15_42845 [Rhodococcus sp. T2V]|nr:hypothetical protein [Rhodococcus sp. T2V]